MNVLNARDKFPYLKHGTIYFNHASMGPISTLVREKLNELLFEKSETEIDNYKKFLSTADETKSLLAKLINTSPDRIAFVDNTSNGVNILAQGIKWKRGDRILLNDLEFPANVYPFLNLISEGVEIDFVKSHDGIVSAEDIVESIKPATRLVSVSQVQFLTGYRIDLAAVGKVCREKGIIFSVDAIQGLGAVQLDVQKDCVDFISCGTQKWLLGLQGFAFIYLTEDLQNRIQQKYVGWTSVKQAWSLLDYNLQLKKSAESFQNGTINFLGVYALNTSLKFLNEFGFESIEKNVIENSLYLINEFEKIGITPYLKKCSKNNLAGIVSFKHKSSKNIFDLLSEKNIICSLREGMIRFSPHFYNVKEESDKIIEVLRNVL